MEKIKNGAIEDLIDVYEDRIRGWFLRPVRTLLAEPDSSFAVLQLAMGYFEGVAVYLNGVDSTGRSKQFFRKAFLEVFPFHQDVHLGIRKPKGFRDRLADSLYEEARCGFFHDGMARSQIYVSKASAPITVSVHKSLGEIGGIVLDPEKVLDAIEAHFSRYIARLRDPKNTKLRNNLVTAWKLKHPTKIYPLPPGKIP